MKNREELKQWLDPSRGHSFNSTACVSEMGRQINKKLLAGIATRIKKLREEKGITQEVFYNDTGIHIGRIESTDRDFSMSTFEAICEYLDISMEEFLKGVKYTKSKSAKPK
jgi:hypothetical protein